MKLQRLLCNILIFLFCTTAFAQNKGPSGIELCNEVHSFLKKNGFSPSSQSLVVSGENTFPYNIIDTFSQEKNSSPENLLLVFFQEDVPQNQAIIKESLKRIKEANYPFTITALFAYGEKQKIEKADMIYGTNVFLESINSNLSYTAVIFDLTSTENVVDTTAEGLSSPPQFIKNALNLFIDNGIGSNLPKVILSQLSSYDFISSPILGRFFEKEIPAIRIAIGNLSPEKKDETSVNIITGFVDLFSKSADYSWEHHFLLIRLFGRFHLISERTILRIVTPVIFVWLIFIFLLIFVNRRLKRHAWYTVAKVWWSVPLTYLLMVLIFFSTGYFFKNFFPNLSYAGKIYGQLILQISSSLFVCLSVYLLILTLNYGFDERAVDYLLVIRCFINQSLFILADISLSPIFIVICFLSLLALYIKNNYLHIAVFLLMIMPLVPYGGRMINAANLRDLWEFLSTSRNVNIIIPLVLYPVYIVLFRILTSVRTKRQKIRYVVLSTAATFVVVSLVLSVFGVIRTSSHNKKQNLLEQNDIAISPLGNQIISLSVSDKIIFDDTIRTLDISLSEKCLLCDVLLTTEELNPVLYSDNDYTIPSSNTARFLIPDNPPSEMTFSYGAAKTPCRITVSAVIEGDQDSGYYFISRSLELGDE